MWPDGSCLMFRSRGLGRRLREIPQASLFTIEEQRLEAAIVEPAMLRRLFQKAAVAVGDGADPIGPHDPVAPRGVQQIQVALSVEYPTIIWDTGAMQSALDRGVGGNGKLAESTNSASDVSTVTAGGGGSKIDVKAVGDFTVELAQFQKYLHYLLYFNKLYSLFGITGDVAVTRALTFVDFKSVIWKGGIRMGNNAAAAEFTRLSKVSTVAKRRRNDGERVEPSATKGLVLFNDAVEFVAKTKLNEIAI
jgi:hypothetical protein